MVFFESRGDFLGNLRYFTSAPRLNIINSNFLWQRRLTLISVSYTTFCDCLFIYSFNNMKMRVRVQIGNSRKNNCSAQDLCATRRRIDKKKTVANFPARFPPRQREGVLGIWRATAVTHHCSKRRTFKSQGAASNPRSLVQIRRTTASSPTRTPSDYVTGCERA